MSFYWRPTRVHFSCLNLSDLDFMGLILKTNCKIMHPSIESKYGNVTSKCVKCRLMKMFKMCEKVFEH